MNKEKNESQKRNKHVSIMMTAAERKFFKSQADRRGTNTANFFRMAAYKLISSESKG